VRNAASRERRHARGTRPPKLLPGGEPPTRWRWEFVPIQTEGHVTHGHLPENDHHGGESVKPLQAQNGAVTSRIDISNFTYSPGDISGASGPQTLPLVRADSPLTFSNSDSLAGIWHSVTTCQAPCTGTAGISYPLADSLPPLDTTELGWAPTPPPIDGTQAASQQVSSTIIPRRLGLQPGAVYTYFCRIHPFMRGAFKVVQ
jgi:hypothetical protein